MGKFEDLTGKKFGRWTVIKDERRKDGKALCRCECGVERLVSKKSLKRKISQSCGCLAHEKIIGTNITHGGSKTNLYQRWQGMRNRCFNKNVKNYKYYGGRGITVCDEWLTFGPFKKWALVSGYSKSLSLDRIDINGNYDPSNCRWVTMKEQMGNTHRNIMVGDICLTEYCKKNNLPYGTIRRRIADGWPVEKAISMPVKKQNRTQTVAETEMDAYIKEHLQKLDNNSPIYAAMQSLAIIRVIASQLGGNQCKNVDIAASPA